MASKVCFLCIRAVMLNRKENSDPYQVRREPGNKEFYSKLKIAKYNYAIAVTTAVKAVAFSIGQQPRKGRITLEIKINKEIRDYTESVFFGLSPRQFFFSLAAVGVAVGLFLGSENDCFL